MCKGVYRAIKATNAVRIIDVGCDRNAGWLPHVIRKLRSEYRMVHLTCVTNGTQALNVGYSGIQDVSMRQMNVYTEEFPETDMLIAYRFVMNDTLIAAMKFFKNVKKSGHVKVLTTENFPDLDANRVSNGTLMMNTGISPFWFPVAIFGYENDEENVEKSPMEISSVKVAELFEERFTPKMEELVDPRKRYVIE